MHEEHIPEYDRIIAHDQDIADTKKYGRFHGANEVPSSISDDLLREAQAYLERYEVETTTKLDELLQELDTAIAINNDPRARELRRALGHRYQREALFDE
jgi:hypothetical protein